jgi:hypothetical protein
MVHFNLSVFDIEFRIERQHRVLIGGKNDHARKHHHLFRREMPFDDVRYIRQRVVIKLGPRSGNYEIPTVMKVFSFDSAKRFKNRFSFAISDSTFRTFSRNLFTIIG